MNAPVRDLVIVDRSYALLEVKAVDEDKRLITGTATTPEPDRMGDIIEPLGVKFRNPLPLLWMHDSRQPIGTVRLAKPTKQGIEFEARMPSVTEPGKLKDRVDEAWQSVKLGIVKGVSIGFRALEKSFMEDGGIHFLATEVLEVSFVTIAANEKATITAIKAMAAASREEPPFEIVGSGSGGGAAPITIFKSPAAKPAASGQGVSSIISAGVTAVKATTSVVKGKPMAKPVAEQISAFEATRQAKAAAMTALMDKAAEEGVTLDDEQTQEYDGLQIEVTKIDEHLKRMRQQEIMLKATARPVEGVTDPVSASEVRGGHVVQMRRNLPKGIPFARFVIALARARGNLMQAHQIALNEKAWYDSPEVEMSLKAAVAAGTTTDSVWAAPLVVYQNLQNEIVELLYPQTIIGRIPNIRRVPFKVKIPRMTTGATVNWVGETKVKPVSSLAFDTVTLEFHKIAGIVPLSEELVRFSSPSAEAIVRDNLVRQIVMFMDSQFIDPTKAAASGVSPASITNGVTPITATGTTAAAFRADIATLLGAVLADNLSIASGSWIMTSSQALKINLMQTSLGTPEFPGISATGGTLLGLPVIVSENIPATGSSPTDGYPIIFVLGSEILLADDGQVTIDASREASLQMDSAPDSPPTASTILVSLWQNNLVGIKAERFITWEKARAEAVSFIQNAKYAE